MINKDRIVPVQKVDLISLYALILKQADGNSTIAKVDASEIGTFAVASASTPLICNEPVKKFAFGSSVSSATVYFVADAFYEGFTKDEATLTVTEPDEGIFADGVTLYKAVLSTNALTITKVGF